MVEKLSQSHESGRRDAKALEVKAVEREQPQITLEQAVESAGETMEIVQATQQGFQQASIEMAAKVLSEHNLRPAELQDIMDNNQIVDRLADLDLQTGRVAEAVKEKIAKKLNPLLVNEQEGFDPVKALKRVRKLPREQKGVVLAEYKSELARQKTALAQLHTRLEEKIRKNPDAEFSELWQEVRRADEQHHFSVYQSDTVAEILHTYKAKHEAVKSATERFSADPHGLFEFALGVKPKGRVKAEIGPMNIHFVCYNFDDYALAWRDLPGGRTLAHTSGAVSITFSAQEALSGTITLEKSTLTTRALLLGRDKAFRPHEEQHAIHKLFTDVKVRRETLNKLMEKTSSPEERAALFASYLRTVRWNFLPSTKDEILAYIKGGTGKWKTYLLLAHSNLYRHMDEPIRGFEAWAKENSQEYSTQAQKAVKQVFITEYRKIIRDGFDAYKALIATGKTRKEAFALLEHEPLQRWPVVVERFKQAEGRV